MNAVECGKFCLVILSAAIRVCVGISLMSPHLSRGMNSVLMFGLLIGVYGAGTNNLARVFFVCGCAGFCVAHMLGQGWVGRECLCACLYAILFLFLHFIRHFFPGGYPDRALSLFLRRLPLGTGM